MSIARVNISPGNNRIGSRAVPACYLCKAVGTLLHEGLNDQLFGAPGTWNLKRCSNPACGLLWLDPMPTELDIAKAYELYYTHDGFVGPEAQTRVQKIKTALMNAYQLCWRWTSLYSEQRAVELMCLGGRPLGRVLEVGCGNGQTLAQLRALGWEIQGQEVDEKAVAQARSVFGVPVFWGPLKQAGFKDEEFDAVVMCHVLEHVHDPLTFLRECKRVLKSGGILVSITPNAGGWGHARFGRSWRGLEPPRHLFLFSRNTLEQVARESGFREVITWTTAAHSLWTISGSLRIQYGEAFTAGAWPTIKRMFLQIPFHIASVMARRRDTEAGDECVLIATS
jgi:2-polyprenyl-3-methyl-5-hydroxy-6-metoxy-1,4-benzoquinol methylase